MTIAGEVDITTIAQLRGQLDSIPDRNTVVEMSEVLLLSASGVTVLLDLISMCVQPRRQRQGATR